MFRRRSWRRERAGQIGIGVAALGLAGAGALGYAAFIEPNWIEVTHIELELPRLSPEFDGYRLVQISDIHAGTWLPTAKLDRAVRMVNRQDADMIAVTGDFVTRVFRGASVGIVPSLSNLQSRDGVVAVLGNHDYWGQRGARLVRRVISDSGMIDLNNKVHTVRRGGAQLQFAGVDSARERRDRLDKVLARLPKEGAAILLAHEPDFVDKSARTGRFDLQISGHSHGGQVALPLLGPPRLPLMGRKYPNGLYHVKDMWLYTNRGLGVVGIPFRFWSRPEITVFTLRVLHSCLHCKENLLPANS